MPVIEFAAVAIAGEGCFVDLLAQGRDSATRKGRLVGGVLRAGKQLAFFLALAFAAASLPLQFGRRKSQSRSARLSTTMEEAFFSFSTFCENCRLQLGNLRVHLS